MLYKSRSVEDDMGNSKTINDHHHVGINNEVEGGNKNDDTEEIVKEVFRITEILRNQKSETEVCKSLSRLESMQFSVETLKATMIGRTVKLLRKHKSKTISSMAKKLVRRWREVVDKWVKSDGMAAAAVQQVQVQVEAKEEESDLKVDESETKMEGSVLVFKRNAQNKYVFSHRRAGVVKPTSLPLPSTSPHVDVKLGNQIPCKEKSKCCDEKAVRERIEASKRRLQEGYRQAEKVKKQRRVQLVEIQNLPNKRAS